MQTQAASIEPSALPVAAPSCSTTAAPPDLASAAERERLRRFAERLDAIRARVEAEIGAVDVAHIRRTRAFSRAMEIAGRTLVFVSPGPVSFLAGVGALWLHKQLEATEIGHSALHGAWDGVPGAEAFASKGFDWRLPIDEESWKVGHNVKHHQYTNVSGKDPDVNIGPIRLNARTPHRAHHYFQVPFALGTALSFTWGMNLHFTGVVGALEPVDKKEAWKKAMRKYVPYFAREFIFFPALAGPLFPKVLLGNWLTEVMRDLYSAATIYCGHVGDDVVDYAAGTRAHGRAEWYRMQVESANNFEVPLPISMLCGALDRQIEHHLFPRFPPNRLREVAPEVRAACVEAGIAYHTDSWGGTLRGVLSRLWRLSFPDAARPAAAG
jgi:NADPH-dependent stearoyl-CoA 9-desaturase